MNQPIQPRYAVADCAIPILIFLLTTIPFVLALDNGFVNWDDEMTLVTNKRYRGLGWAELQWMFTTLHMGHYQPLSWLSFALDHFFWGLDPFGFHLTNLILHGVNAVLVYFVARRFFALTLVQADLDNYRRLVLLGVFAALLFGVHPLRVESVAWATQRRDVLSALFLLSTVLLYLSAVGKPLGSVEYKWRMGGAIMAFAASLLAKAAGITFPIVLFVLDVYPLGRLNGVRRGWFERPRRSLVWEKIPFVLLAVFFGIIALVGQHDATALKHIERYGIGVRIAQGFYGIGFYLWKTVAPIYLSPLYELPVHFNVFAGPFVVSALVVIGISFALFQLRLRWPVGIAAWLIYIAILFPVLGIAQSGPQLTADRYSYLACLPWAIMAGGSISYFWRSGNGERNRNVGVALSGFGFLFVVGLAVLTWNQVQVWHDSEKLWRHAVATSPDSATAHYNLGVVLGQRGAIDAAERQYERSLAINPAASDAHNNLGLILVRRGKIADGMRHYHEAVRLDPGHKGAYINLASLALRQDDLTRAASFYQKALTIDQADADAHYNLGEIFTKLGDREKSAQHFREAARINPGDADAQVRLAGVALERRDIDGAIAHLQQALKSGTDRSEIEFKLGTLLAMTGQLGEATAYFERAIRGKPDFAEAHHNLGRVTAAQGDLNRAIKHFREAVRLQPDFAAAHESLAIALAEQGSPAEALKQRQILLRLQNSKANNPATR